MYNKEKMREATKMFIEAIGEDPNRDGLKRTPERVAEMYSILLNGYDIDPQKYVKLFKEEKFKGMVAVMNIPFYSFCEHHIMLFTGKVSIAYIPNKNKVFGLSKLVRIMRVFAKRLQIQERMADQIADVLTKNGFPDVLVHISAEHFCMAIRGVRLPGTLTVTTAERGEFATNEKIRNEFFQMVNKNG